MQCDTAVRYLKGVLSHERSVFLSVTQEEK